MYGPIDLALRTGEWLSTIGMYLQQPEHCDRNVRYCNPQCLTFGKATPAMTYDLECEIEAQPEEQARTCPVTLAELYDNIEYSEYHQPAEIATVLHRHQKQALTFMTQRELGWAMTDDTVDIWRCELDERNVVRYRNRLTGESQVIPPKPFRGGILADDMGLGKTCSMLALIAVDMWRNEMIKDRLNHAQGHVKSTLIVVPFSLLDVWSDQIKRHFIPDTVRYCIYHSQHNRPQEVVMGDYDTIITTYNTMACEWKKNIRSIDTFDMRRLFGVIWHRVILDEVHFIRTRQTISSKAVAALRAERRWCVTGTPIQNRLTDMYSLLRFFGVDPYDQYNIFEEQILRPFKTGDNTALKKLQALIKTVVLRRPRAIVALPPVYERVEVVAFTDPERSCYDGARDSIIEIIDLAIDGAQPKRSTCFNAFQRINDLRYICNHGTRSRRSRMKHEGRDNGEKSPFAFELDKLLSAAGQMCCQCGIQLGERTILRTTLSMQQCLKIRRQASPLSVSRANTILKNMPYSQNLLRAYSMFPKSMHAVHQAKFKL